MPRGGWRIPVRIGAAAAAGLALHRTGAPRMSGRQARVLTWAWHVNDWHVFELYGASWALHWLFCTAVRAAVCPAIAQVVGWSVAWSSGVHVPW